ncbi:MAG: YbaB/EbfC family nucleoid-associated protein [Chitinophagaceae bacterium]|nr:YbaB/EbfC family nucleoid-associated protein [Anaerolineae bacterium]
MSKKRGGFPGGGGMPGGNAGMLKQLQKMQQDMVEAQEALANETVEVSVGGGAVTIVISGHQRIQSIVLKKEMIDTSDDEWINDMQDMLVVAMNQAIEQSQTMAAQRMEGITGGLGDVPGLGGLLG